LSRHPLTYKAVIALSRFSLFSMDPVVLSIPKGQMFGLFSARLKRTAKKRFFKGAPLRCAHACGSKERFRFPETCGTTKVVP